ncbi:LETMD1 [Cordylochernes scorpioides]|uniref:LETMD1 n=1 Tax=Cordylochernes scorpioides TaxID=51811 RepID=A0ABY6K5F4_9ARAC|nr:LETMD1 [Cordylochernes scorpioides]
MLEYIFTIRKAMYGDNYMTGHVIVVPGTKELYNDISLYMKVSSQLRNGKSVRDLSFKELEKYHQLHVMSTPGSQRHGQGGPGVADGSSALLQLHSLSLGWLVGVARYLFPRALLTPQFWSLQQKVHFSSKSLGRRLDHYRPVFRNLQLRLSYIENEALRDVCSRIYYKVAFYPFLWFQCSQCGGPNIPDILKSDDKTWS